MKQAKTQKRVTLSDEHDEKLALLVSRIRPKPSRQSTVENLIDEQLRVVVINPDTLRPSKTNGRKRRPR